jgi:hypothetical protein
MIEGARLVGPETVDAAPAERFLDERVERLLRVAVTGGASRQSLHVHELPVEGCLV